MRKLRKVEIARLVSSAFELIEKLKDDDRNSETSRGSLQILEEALYFSFSVARLDDFQEYINTTELNESQKLHLKSLGLDPEAEV